METTYLIFIIAYLVGISIYGWYLNKKFITNSDDFVTAGRVLPFPVLVGTLLATWMGSGMITGTANFIYERGPIAAIFFLIGEPVGLLLIALFLAKRIREKVSYTLPELIEEKYGVVARTIVALCIVLAYIGIVSYQFTAGGYILNLVTGISVPLGTFISAVFIVFISVVGGLVSVAYTDAIGTLIIFAAMIIGLPLAVSQAGGLSALLAALPAEKTTVTGGLSNVQLIGYMLPVIFLVLGEQNIYQRFGAAKDPKEATRSGFGLFGLALLLDFLVIALVATSIVLFPNLENPDTAFLQVAMGLPTIVGGLIIACSVALFVTTADSYLLSASTNVIYDIWVRLFRPKATDKEKIVAIRVCIILLALFALVIGTFFPSILDIQMYAYSMYGAAITPALLGALFWKKATKAGGLSSIIVGGGTVLVWDVLLKTPGDLNSILIAGPLAILVLIVVSLGTQNRKKKF
ncbi:sodium:solute symporter family protein [Irregularibacter muris]|uniref:Sodium:solute symporter family protein n=1 Tax=Irregularibacter muris TaxID=1796619 RepID=A0AAE3KYW8_9FIRM|nr:sodium:solute symporter family protein [Irregularibacter muris]MCR1898335.1 sodium:solute symporter family protein [Irregularibacter muris]